MVAPTSNIRTWTGEVRQGVADEMGATLDLTAAAKTVLIATITAAIHAAVAEERQQPTWVL